MWSIEVWVIPKLAGGGFRGNAVVIGLPIGGDVLRVDEIRPRVTRVVHLHAGLHLRHREAVLEYDSRVVLIHGQVASVQYDGRSCLKCRDGPQGPAANDLVKNFIVIEECPALAEGEIVCAAKMKHIANIEGARSIV